MNLIEQVLIPRSTYKQSWQNWKFKCS